jgi:hypothetical protein
MAQRACESTGSPCGTQEGPQMIGQVLRSQEECVEQVRARLYKLPARLRKVWKAVWAHLYPELP